MRTSVVPIVARDLDEVGEFLATHLNRKIAASDWRRSLTQEWAARPPNYGMKLVVDGRTVGVFLAIYSDQCLRGQPESFCNPHSWCVLPDFRSEAVKLASALIRQPGYHFSMLTPNPNVEAVFRYMKFKELDPRVAIFPMLPSVTRMKAIDHQEEIRSCLSGSALDDYERHASFEWLRHFVVTEGDSAQCLITFKLRRWKRMPCADLLGVSDPRQFSRYLPAIRNYLIFRAGALWGRVEERFIDAAPVGSYRTIRTQPKLFLSKTLTDSDIRDLYSELVALDL